MVKCTLAQLHIVLANVCKAYRGEVVTKRFGNNLDYYVGLVHIGTEKGLTETMFQVNWKDRYKSDRVYIFPEYLEEFL